MKTLLFTLFLLIAVTNAQYGVYLTVYEWSSYGCSSSPNNTVTKVSVYAANSTCFQPTSNGFLAPNFSYRITRYNSSLFVVQQFNSTSLDCSGPPSDIFYYYTYVCYGNYNVNGTNTFPTAQNWLNLPGTWPVVLQTNYYNGTNCSKWVDSIAIGLPVCNSSSHIYCQNNAIHLDWCPFSPCAENCTSNYFPPLGEQCQRYSGDWSIYGVSNAWSQSYCASTVVPIPSVTPAPSRSPNVTIPSPSRSPNVTVPSRSPSPTPIPTISPSYVTFTEWNWNGCYAYPNNSAIRASVYPNNTCFQPTPGGFLDPNFSYFIQDYEVPWIAVLQFLAPNCTVFLNYTTYYIGCSDNVFVNTTTTFPVARDWLSIPQTGWQTVLQTNYYRNLNCGSSQWIDSSVVGFPECSGSEHIYCDRYTNTSRLDYCVNNTCPNMCYSAFTPLTEACQVVNGQWQSVGISDAAYSTTFCAGSLVAPSPSAAPSRTPSRSPNVTIPSPSRSPSPIPTVSASYVTFTEWNWDGCFAYPNNSAVRASVYPNGTCFQPTPGGFLDPNYSYFIFATPFFYSTVYVEQFSPNCTEFMNATEYYIGCNNNVYVNRTTTFPVARDWLSIPQIGWQTVLQTNYYENFYCSSSQWIDSSVVGFPECSQNERIYCDRYTNTSRLDYCVNNTCPNMCYSGFTPLTESCQVVYGQWQSVGISDAAYSETFCAGSAIAPSPSAIPSRSPNATFPSSSRSPNVTIPSPSRSPNATIPSSTPTHSPNATLPSRTPMPSSSPLPSSSPTSVPSSCASPDAGSSSDDPQPGVGKLIVILAFMAGMIAGLIIGMLIYSKAKARIQQQQQQAHGAYIPLPAYGAPVAYYPPPHAPNAPY